MICRTNFHSNNEWISLYNDTFKHTQRVHTNTHTQYKHISHTITKKKTINNYNISKNH